MNAEANRADVCSAQFGNQHETACRQAFVNVDVTQSSVLGDIDSV